MKNFVFASILVSTAGFSSEQNVVKRGSIQKSVTKTGAIVGYLMRDLGDNWQLQQAGVEKGDILQKLCGVRIDSREAFIQADNKLQVTKEKCEIVVQRNLQKITLDFIP